MDVQRDRPFGVSVLAALAVMDGLANLFVAVLFAGILPLALFGSVGFFGLALLGILLWGVVAIIWFSVAVGLWTLNPGALTFVILVAGLNLILAVVSVIGASTWQSVLPCVIVNGIILVYALTPDVRRAFRL